MNYLKQGKSLSFPLVILLIGAFVFSGCASSGNTGKGAAVGAGAGAVIGGILGNTQGSTGKGAIIGAAVGGTAGAIIGRQMDQQAEELDESLEDAEIVRVGEGIQIVFDSAILFDVNSSDLKANSVSDLETLAASLKEYPNTDVVIVGHTDATGTEEYNQALSERRAGSAADQLIAAGVSPSRVTTVGKGEMEPVGDNATVDGRQSNRRVEVAIFANEEYRQSLEESGD
ncbi:MAG: OmpA family protein [Rhodothermales bacterium]|nr:OmpA family protein [Rhodothermales bacterium]